MQNHLTNDVSFSEASRFLAQHYGVVDRAERILWDEWRKILEAVAVGFRAHGYWTNVEGSSDGHWGFLQVAPTNWPQPYNASVHFEVGCGRDFAVQSGQHVLTLEVEGAVADKGKLIQCIQRILKPYEGAGLLLKTTGCTISPDSAWRVFERKLPMGDASSTKIASALENLLPTMSFVDEALLLSPVTSVWRSSFFPDEIRPRIQWAQWKECEGATGETGGWETRQDGGRLDSPCLFCDGRKSNYHDRQNILTLRPADGWLHHGIASGQKVRCCAVVYSPRRALVKFHAEATEAGKFKPAFESWIEVDAFDGWQALQWEVTAGQIENYDSATQGLSAFLMVRAPETGLRIDSIEFGILP
jgi:hypothetical protein